ncbi:MAG: four-carbon acid sugar kinase family protein [Prevotellaceae bacterium]|jgi:uncharacterized protein YgbK (DUF1537 family)|nr:four-carbon acid sugar kinase family protein [Prevotellaceae bacterium]
MIRTPLVVIADDITGAAELGGIALRLGRHPLLLLYRNETQLPASVHSDDASYDTFIFATDTRQQSEAAAVAQTSRLGSLLAAAGYTHLYKKTDSVLRGHVVAELKALMQALSVEQSVLLPQNPSLGRIIQEGRYYIHGVPLDETAFAHDPEFPATSADAAALLGLHAEDNILLPDADSVAEVKRQCIRLARAEGDDRRWLPAGGADFFEAWVRQLDGVASPVRPAPSTPFLPQSSLPEAEAAVLLVCGSTARHPLPQGFLRCNMPEKLFAGRISSRAWIDSLLILYRQGRPLALTIDYPPQPGKAVAVHLRSVMSEVVAALLAQGLPRTLLIEGGATAYAILEALRWESFELTRELRRGVIGLRPLQCRETELIMKPGSYFWV